MAALDGALPLPQMNHVALAITKDLDLDVVAALDVLLNEHLKKAGVGIKVVS